MGASTSVIEKALLDQRMEREDSRRIAKVLKRYGIDTVDKAKLHLTLESCRQMGLTKTEDVAVLSKLVGPSFRQGPGARRYAVFISHYGAELRGTAGMLYREFSGYFPGQRIFRDEDEHFNIGTSSYNRDNSLAQAAQMSDVFVVLASSHAYLTRPYCILELCNAMKGGANLLVITVKKDKSSPDYAFEDVITEDDTLLAERLRNLMKAEGLKVLEKWDIKFEYYLAAVKWLFSEKAIKYFEGEATPVVNGCLQQIADRLTTLKEKADREVKMPHDKNLPSSFRSLQPTPEFTGPMDKVLSPATALLLLGSSTTMSLIALMGAATGKINQTRTLQLFFSAMIGNIVMLSVVGMTFFSSMIQETSPPKSRLPNRRDSLDGISGENPPNSNTGSSDPPLSILSRGNSLSIPLESTPTPGPQIVVDPRLFASGDQHLSSSIPAFGRRNSSIQISSMPPTDQSPRSSASAMNELVRHNRDGEDQSEREPVNEQLAELQSGTFAIDSAGSVERPKFAKHFTDELAGENEVTSISILNVCGDTTPPQSLLVTAIRNDDTPLTLDTRSIQSLESASPRPFNEAGTPNTPPIRNLASSFHGSTRSLSSPIAMESVASESPREPSCIESGYVALVPNPEKSQLLRYKSKVLSVSFKPSSGPGLDSWLACGYDDSQISIHKSDDLNVWPKSHIYVKTDQPCAASAVAFQNRGSKLASGFYSGQIMLWDVSESTYKLHARISEHSKAMMCMAFASRNDSLLATGSWGEVVLWDLNKAKGFSDDPSKESRSSGLRQNQCRKSAFTSSKGNGHGNEFVRSVCFSGDDKYLVSGGQDKKVILWDVQTTKLVREFTEHADWILSSTFSNQYLIASGSEDKTIKLWDCRTKTSVGTLRGHTGTVTHLCFDPSNAFLVSSSEDCTVRVWNLALQESPVRIEDLSSSVVGTGFLHSEGKKLVTVTSDRITNVFDW